MAQDRAWEVDTAVRQGAMLPEEELQPTVVGRPLRARSRPGGYTFVPLEVDPPADSTITPGEANGFGGGELFFEHRLLSQRLADNAVASRHRQSTTTRGRCIVTFLVFLSVAAGILLWMWALVLLLLRLNQLRQPHFGNDE